MTTRGHLPNRAAGTGFALGLVLALCTVAASCGPPMADPAPPPESTVPAPTTSTTMSQVEWASATDVGLPWWNDRVFYEVFVRSFADSDGDGIGDLAGLTERLDYLNDGDPSTDTDLGVTGIWLMPVFDSPSYHGYDVVDYRSIEPEYGSIEDFNALLDAAGDRGIAVIVDLVINHSSVRHPWFAESRDPATDRIDWYLWQADDPQWRGPWGQEVWHPDDGEYYYGIFWEGMPDLNLANQAVTAEMHDIARFWLVDVGVDGFRLDAARHLIEDGPIQTDTPQTHAWLADFRAEMHKLVADSLILGEVWSDTETIGSYLPGSLDLAFEFALSEAFLDAMARWQAEPLVKAQQAVLDEYPEGQFAPFLTNHDMDRIMSQLGDVPERARLAATWLLTAPGTPFIYYGEEIGMEGEKPDEDIRTPMAWTGEPPSVGFSDGIPWNTPDPSFKDANVADQTDDPDSLLSLYRDLIQFRNESPSLRFGETILLDAGHPSVYAVLRVGDTEQVLTVLNLSGRPV
ncbi:MAG: alpha-amylase family glycosyl hydrolase, partial [Actinomycetota bacterium]|nr:alpha-amylase family glycosyl hydrolase [Actinomycetota bacterium]